MRYCASAICTHAVLQVNETWTSGCHSCQCKESGLECIKKECKLICPPGTKLAQASDTQCCQCVPVEGCLHNGVVYPEDRVIVDLETCQEKTCEAGAKQVSLEWKERPISCDQYCAGNQTSEEMDKCCKCPTAVSYTHLTLPTILLV